MRNDAWAEFVGIRAEQRSTFARLLALYLSGDHSEMTLGRVAGALYQLTTLPYSRGAADEIEQAVDAAHRINKQSERPCGCDKRKRCVLDEVSPDLLMRTLAQTDPCLRLDEHLDYYDEDDEG